MNKAYSACLLLVYINTTIPIIKECSISIEPQWQNLENNTERAQQFGGKWILAGSITFKKTCNSPVHLNELRFVWNGIPLNQLQGSLFKANDSEPFKPINKNHIADSSWSKKEQSLIFKFAQSISLHPTTIFYLVLTIPEEQEKKLKGSFSILPHYLPLPFQEALQKEKMDLHLDIMGSSIESR